MQYVLTEQEYKSLISEEKHQKVVKGLLDNIDKNHEIISKLKEEVMKNRPCYQKGSSAYCDGCPLGFENLGLCTGITNYSK